MVKIKDVSLEEFMYLSRNKKVIAVGAGRKLLPFVKRHDLADRIVAIVDGDVSKQGKRIKLGTKSIDIVGYDALNELDHMSNAIILISALLPIVSILNQLDGISGIDDVECFIAPLMEDKFIDDEVEYTIGNQVIDKTIHYFWFGKADIPKHLQKYIASWSRVMPDYSIIRWDESNYDVQKNKYMKEAYECGKFGFVPDYARLDVLYHYGGIYLDTDVEVIKPFDDLLCDDAFMGFYDSNGVALGAGFGCVKGNDLIGQFMDAYNNLSFFDDDGHMNLTTCIEYQYPILKSYGFKMNNTQQCLNKVMVYPVQVFNPEGKTGLHTHYTKHTHSIHRSEISYENAKTRSDYFAIRNYLPKRMANS